MTMKNLDIRVIVSDNGLRYKDIAKELHISPEWLSRLMRNTLTIGNRHRILEVIEKMIHEKNGRQKEIML